MSPPAADLEAAALDLSFPPVSGDVVGVGIDLCDIGRLAAVLRRRPGLIERLFTSEERHYAAASSNWVPRLATRFCAKEAAMKVLGVGIGSVRFDEVAVTRSDLGPPLLAVTGRAAVRATEAGVGRWHVSLTHSATTAAALVVAVRSPLPSSGSTS